MDNFAEHSFLCQYVNAQEKGQEQQKRIFHRTVVIVSDGSDKKLLHMLCGHLRKLKRKWTVNACGCRKNTMHDKRGMLHENGRKHVKTRSCLYDETV